VIYPNIEKRPTTPWRNLGLTNSNAKAKFSNVDKEKGKKCLKIWSEGSKMCS